MAVETLERVAAALRRRGFDAVCCATRAEAAAHVMKLAEGAATVGQGGSVTLNAVPVAQNTKNGKSTTPRTITQEELAGYLADSAVQKSRSGRFDSSYLLIKEKDGSVTTVWYESETDIAEKTELCKLLGVKTVYILK